MRAPSSGSFRSRLGWAFAIFWAVYFWRVWSLALFVDEHGIRSGWIASWSDGAAHLSYMSTFAYREDFPTEHPLFVGKAFSYPYAADLIGGLLVRAGMPLYAAYDALGFALSMLFVIMVWRTFTSVYGDELAAFLGGLVFFFGAGLANARYLFDEDLWPRFDTYGWVDIISGYVMAQRALLLGMPLALFVLLQIWRFSQKGNSTPMMASCGVIAGLLPVIHAHSLIVLFVISAWLCAVDVHQKKKLRSGWCWYAGIAVVLGSGFLLNQIQSFDARFWRWQPGWLPVIKGEPVWWFWLKSWGIWPLLVVFGWRFLTQPQKLLLAPVALVFALANLFIFQPYDFDNTKLFLWVYLLFSGVVGLAVARLLRTSNWLARLAAVSSIFALTFSGVVDAAKLLRPQADRVLHLFTHGDLKFAESIRAETDPEGVFLTSDSHLNLIPTLTGRQIVMGFPGWLWTYGIDASARTEDVASMYGGGENAEALFDRYGVSYVVFDPNLSAGPLGKNEAYFSSRYPIAVSNEAIRIYDVREPIRKHADSPRR